MVTLPDGIAKEQKPIVNIYMKYLLCFVILAGCFSCKVKSTLSEECNTVGTVKDFNELDGCGLLIELENGDLLNPLKIIPDFQLEARQIISFSYRTMENMKSSCRGEKAIVEIICIRALGKTPEGEGGCVDTDNPFAVEWMDHAIDLHNPNQVLKYKNAAEWLYLFRSIPSSYLYDCRGKLICETKNDHDKCHNDYLGSLGQGKIIWQGEGIWD